MNYRREFLVEPGKKVRLADLDPSFAPGREDKKSAAQKIEHLQKEMDDRQFRLYAEKKQSLLIVLQAPDAGGKDGVVRHVVGSMSPQSCRVANFKEPTPAEFAHDFLWRVEAQTPEHGEVVIFNRSHYEDVLIVRVHNLVPKKIWSKRFDQINAFEERLAANGTRILKFYLHISKKEQLRRFERRFDDPARRWKISEADYKEREYWNDYVRAYEEVLERCSTKDAPWFVIPSDHKWFRNLTISHIIVDELKKMNFRTPKPTADLELLRRKYHAGSKQN